MANDGNEKWNFSTLLGQGTFVYISYELTSPRLVLPFLYMAVGAPVLFAGLIFPVVQTSNLISQFASARILASRSLRKWYMMLGLIAMALALTVVAGAVYGVKSAWMAVLFLAAAAIIGISQGVSTLAFQDLLGRVLSGVERSRLLFSQAALAGVLTVVIAFGSQRYINHDNALGEHLELLWIGIAVTVIAGVTAGFVRETRPIGAAGQGTNRSTDGAGDSTVKELFNQLISALKIAWFRRYLTARSLLLSIEMAMPFYAVHAATLHAQEHYSLSTFVMASGLGLVAGGMLWQLIARVSTGAVMSLACAVACAGGGIAVAIDMMDLRSSLLNGAVFLLIALANAGTRNARKLYLVDFTNDEERPYYLAISNVVAGAIGAIVSLAFGVLAQLQDVIWPIWCIIGLNVIAGLYTLRLAKKRTRAADSAAQSDVRAPEANLPG